MATIIHFSSGPTREINLVLLAKASSILECEVLIFTMYISTLLQHSFMLYHQTASPCYILSRKISENVKFYPQLLSPFRSIQCVQNSYFCITNQPQAIFNGNYV